MTKFDGKRFVIKIPATSNEHLPVKIFIHHSFMIFMGNLLNWQPTAFFLKANDQVPVKTS